ncbi:putative transcriptional regulator [Calothrix sp. NIES-4071]|nr:putative transcriptional regulator [Calothrix sp. NIES-4071]BAZ64306.1 putative transcriptional regulator [Calothrix sp. NIES-4105]
MNTNSQFNDRSQSQTKKSLFERDVNHTNDFTGAMDMVKRDRFELISAYLDGEVTAAERKQVEEWLVNDQSAKTLYNRLLKLRQSLRTLPIPESQQPIEETVERVLGKLQRRRVRLAGLFGGAAIAACAFGALSGIFSGDSKVIQFASQPVSQPVATKSNASSKTLMVALNQPVFPIPKTEVAPVNPVGRQRQTANENGLY